MTVQRLKNKAGLPMLHVQHTSGASIDIHLSGASTENWITATGARPLYVTPMAQYGKGKALRGGIPICWPQFSDMGPLPAHGYARNSMWTFVGAKESPKSTTVVLRLVHPDAKEKGTEAHLHATVEFVVELGAESLSALLRVTNNATSDLNFTMALHTYAAVSDVTAVRLEGEFDKARFTDNVRGKQRFENEKINKITGWTERLYEGVNGKEVRLIDPKAGTVTRFTATGLNDAVLWNPWSEKKFADLPADGHRHFLCIESAAFAKPIVVKPGATWTGGQHIHVAKPRPSKL